MSKKFKFKLDGMEFNLPIKHLKKTDWNGNPIKPQISINHSAGSNLLKQYVKLKYPNVVVSVSSSTFSMGNSVDVYISDELGNEVDKAIIDARLEEILIAEAQICESIPFTAALH